MTFQFSSALNTNIIVEEMFWGFFLSYRRMCYKGSFLRQVSHKSHISELNIGRLIRLRLVS